MAKGSGRGWIKDVIIVGIGVLIIWVGLQIVFGTQNPFYVVSSGSMVPELNVFDVLIVDRRTNPFESVEVGDVIVFNRPAGQDRVIVHRVAAIIDDDPRSIRTKGDANPASIPGTDFPITEEEYIGEVAHVIPKIGYVTRVLTPPINYIIIGIIIVIMVVKQISKGRKEHELSSTFEFDSKDHDNPKDPPSTFDELDKVQNDKEGLDKIPKDKEYTEISKEVRDAALREEGINFDSEEESKKNPEDSTKKKPEE